MINPITQRATLRRVLQHHVEALQIQLSKLDQGLRLAGVDPSSANDDIHQDLVNCIRMVHVRLGTLYALDADNAAELYPDNRGLHP